MWVDAADAPEPHQTFEQAELPPALLTAVSFRLVWLAQL
jgi:hypothetical protein